MPKRTGFEVPVWSALCEARKDLNESEKEAMSPPISVTACAKPNIMDTVLSGVEGLTHPREDSYPRDHRTSTKEGVSMVPSNLADLNFKVGIITYGWRGRASTLKLCLMKRKKKECRDESQDC